MITYVLVQITDMDSLLKAYQLTDNGAPSGNIVATIAVGPIQDLTTGMRPTLPIIDWKGGTPKKFNSEAKAKPSAAYSFFRSVVLCRCLVGQMLLRNVCQRVPSVETMEFGHFSV